MANRFEAEAGSAAFEAGFREQVAMMTRALIASPSRNTILAFSAGILAVLVATAFGQVLINQWNEPFYDALENRNLSAFLHQLLVFAQIAGALLVLNVLQTWLNQMLHIKLREWLTRDLIAEWMRPRRAFRLAKAGVIGVNPDQRMHEDARHLADLTASLGIGLAQATIVLVSFVGVLWSLSEGFVLRWEDSTFTIPGYMVWAAILYAGTASCLSWLVGRPLVRLNSERYAREAELRFSLVRVSENVDAISLAAGEADERRRLDLDLADVLEAMRRIVMAVVNLTWVTASYGWITVVAPIVIASPVYFSGDLTFGGLMMAAAAFTQVHASLRWFVDNISGIADWRATLLRVASFRSALQRVDELHQTERRIAFDAADRLVFDNVEIASPAGCTRMQDAHVEIGAGERVVVTGSPGVGKTLFFRALAGLWPWGKGRIGLPQGVAFMPRLPYLPPGSLRDVLAYPLGADAFADPELQASLERVGLARLGGSLERIARWDRELNEDDQRLLGFARLTLHRPAWVVIDEALDALQDDARTRVLTVLGEALPGSAIVNIGQADEAAPFFTRVLHLSFDPKGHALTRARSFVPKPGTQAEEPARQPAP